MINAIIFDFGRVISAPKPRSLFRNYENDLALKPDSINTIMFDSQAWHETLIGHMPEQEYWQRIGPELGLNTSEQIEYFHRRYRNDESLNKGILPLIKALHGRYKLAVLSNSPPGLSHWLEDWEILAFFETVFCSGDEGVAKPDPSAYRTTLERLQVTPDEAVFIDDTKENVEAAGGQGLHSILFTTVPALKTSLIKLKILF